MAITLIRKEDPDGKYNNLMFRTMEEVVEKETGEEGADPAVLGTITLVDDELKPLSESVKLEIRSSEENYHRKLRDGAAKLNHLITSHSTNPEWNPEGYIKNLK